MPSITRHPTADWIIQQLREALPDAPPYRYAIFDHDSKFTGDVISFLKSAGLKPKRTTFHSPWQNGSAERWAGSCRREILDHVIAISERHLLRLLRDYVGYYHQDRIHDELKKDTPTGRPVQPRPGASAKVISTARLGGLHHRYDWPWGGVAAQRFGFVYTQCAGFFSSCRPDPVNGSNPMVVRFAFRARRPSSARDQRASAAWIVRATVSPDRKRAPSDETTMRFHPDYRLQVASFIGVFARRAGQCDGAVRP